MPAACVAAECSASQAALGALSPPTRVGTRATATATAKALAQQRVYYALKQEVLREDASEEAVYVRNEFEVRSTRVAPVQHELGCKLVLPRCRAPA
jgi:hypothetical protein